ncbi:hypothetical protein V6N13_108116 [Hibiscus sabdariffa]
MGAAPAFAAMFATMLVMGNQAYFAAYQLEFLDAAVYRHCSVAEDGENWSVGQRQLHKMKAFGTSTNPEDQLSGGGF